MKSYKKERFKTKEEWKANHTQFLGGSSAGVLFGVNKWKTKLELYREIVYPIKNEKEVTNENIELGVSSEPLIRKTFALNFPNYKVISPKGWESYIDKRRPYLGATVDGLLVDLDTGEKGILEIKTADIRRHQDLDNWEGSIPDQYYCQILHYLMVLKDHTFVKLVAQLRYFDWQVPLANKVTKLETRFYHIDRSEVQDDIDKLERAEVDFWENHIIPRIPPSMTREIGD